MLTHYEHKGALLFLILVAVLLTVLALSVDGTQVAIDGTQIANTGSEAQRVSVENPPVPTGAGPAESRAPAEYMATGMCLRDSKPLPDCPVVISSGEGTETFRGLTGPDGRFEVSLRGTARVWQCAVQHSGFIKQVTSAQRNAGRVAFGNISLQLGARLSPRLLLDGGQPVIGVRISLTRLPNAAETHVGFSVSNQDGYAEFPFAFAPGDYQVTLHDRDHFVVRGTKCIVTEHVDSSPIVILQTTDINNAVSGRAVDVAGMGVSGVMVSVTEYDLSGGFVTGSARTDIMGRFRVTVKGPVSEVLSLQASDPKMRFMPAMLAGPFHSGQTGIVIRLAPPRQIDLLVVDAETRRPIEEFAIDCAPMDAIIHTNKSSILSQSQHQEGRLRVRLMAGGLAADSVRIWVRPKDAEWQEELLNLNANNVAPTIVVALQRSHDIAFRVLDSAGRPVVGATIALLSSSVDPVKHSIPAFAPAARINRAGYDRAGLPFANIETTLKTDGNGVCDLHLDSRRLETYWVEATASDRQPQIKKLTKCLVAGSYEFRLDATGVVEGMIRGRTSDGSDDPDWVALVYDGRHKRLGLIKHSMAADGRFRISGAPAGRCSVVLHMQMPGGLGKVTSVLAKDLLVKPDGVSRIEADTAELFRTRRVRVIMDGQPVVQATCRVELQSDQESDTPAPWIAKAVTTDEKGYCTFQAPIGDYRIIARIPGLDNPCVAITAREDGELVARISYRPLTLKLVCEGFQDFVAGRRFAVRTATGDHFEVRPGVDGVVEFLVPTDAEVINVDVQINMRRDWSLFAGGIIELSRAERRSVEGARGRGVLLGRPVAVNISNKRAVTLNVGAHLFR